ncbi:VPLPA-CTERM sorting domain-containing protein [Pseudodesulfovibrio portus]|uniref:Uncharacterized protein n=1 Tax=Pseudodesulfovibrio portus TaxID=231439 RepID=A0ABN6RWI7_9BACT|nr:VPLPA-CTERM sorting domain-containing protein [Pseudodesulfovibrio portus]BDQ34008.1 hypothetical protein JCM14722_15500 [Pseudodesulfovibrio portus]
MNSRIVKTVWGLLLISLCIVGAKAANAAYTLEKNPNDSSATAQNLDPYFSSDISYLVETDLSGTIANWSASVYGFSGDNTYDYYSFSVGTAGSSLHLGNAVSFDIDFAEVAGLDTVLTLYDTDGTRLLAYNDDSGADCAGDLESDTFNSFFRYTFNTAGTYYIRVGQYLQSGSLYGGPLVADATYHLHVGTTNPTPIPGAVWLLGSGLVGLVGIRRKMKA